MLIMNALNLVNLNFKKTNIFRMIEHKIPRYIIIIFKIYYLGSIIMSSIHFYLNPNLNNML